MIHLLPYDGIGGAEAAARSMADAPPAAFDFELRYLFPAVTSSRQRAGTNNPLALLSAVRGILRDPPDLLIVSLWRACIAGILVRLLGRRTRLVVLIHNSVDAHWLDYVFTRWAMALATAVWADSDASVRMRFGKHAPADVVTIPFLTTHLAPLEPREAAVLPAPSFIFWGRLAAQKNLAKALEVFRLVRNEHPGARYTIIGPDSGELPALRRRCAELGLDDAVDFAGPMAFADIRERARDHAFYLQTSNYEGMAMSVVESMQLGLVPVVTPVGEIGRYCRAGHNAVIVEDPAQASAALLALLRSPAAYRKLRDNGILTWQDQALYSDAVAAECLRLLGQRADAVTRGDNGP